MEEHNDEKCHFLREREAFMAEIEKKILEANLKQDCAAARFEELAAKRFEKLEENDRRIEEKVDSGFSHLDNGWKKDLINKLVGVKSQRYQVVLEIIKTVAILAGSGGILFVLMEKVLK